jgi:hypothetical protein
MGFRIFDVETHGGSPLLENPLQFYHCCKTGISRSAETASIGFRNGIRGNWILEAAMGIPRFGLTGHTQNGITVISMRFSFDPRKHRRLGANPRRRIGFEEALELFSQPYWLDQRSDVPEQFLAVGWVGGLYSVIFEFRKDRGRRDSASRHAVEVNEGGDSIV